MGNSIMYFLSTSSKMKTFMILIALFLFFLPIQGEDDAQQPNKQVSNISPGTEVVKDDINGYLYTKQKDF